MLVKQVYFHWTARGGGRQASSCLLPIARWLQRRLVFMAVKDEANLLKKLEEHTTTNSECGVEDQPVEEGTDDGEQATFDDTMWI